MNTDHLNAAVAIARALGHPARLRSLAVLRTGELCVCQITAVLELAPSTVSAHLRELRRAGLTVERKEGRWVYVGLSRDPEARAWVDQALASACDDEQLRRDEEMVEKLRRLPLEDLCGLGYDAAMAKNVGFAGGSCGTGSSSDSETR